MSRKTENFLCLLSFTDRGVDPFRTMEMPFLDEKELMLIGNYYSIVVGQADTEGLYGPLPVAYHTEYLLYVYTFKIKNKNAKDQRIIKSDYIVPASLLILFPTTDEYYANQSRDKIANGIKVWRTKFTDISEITRKQLDALNSSLAFAMEKEKNQQVMSETEKITVVLSKSIELLHNVSNYHNKQLKILIAGTDKALLQLSRMAFLNRNGQLIDSFSSDRNSLKISLGKINFQIVNVDDEKPNVQKYLSNDLAGVMYFGNYENEKLGNIHSQQLEEIIKHTNQNSLISFAISQNKEPIAVDQTKLPEYLSKGIGRTISLFDLANENMNIGRAILESLDKLVEVTARVRN